jgi:hypothetical protein
MERLNHDDFGLNQSKVMKRELRDIADKLTQFDKAFDYL